MSKRLSVSYVYPKEYTFVKRDIQYMESEFVVRKHSFLPSSSWKLPLCMLVQAFRLLGEIPMTDIVVCQFAGYHTLVPSILAKVFNKPLLVIASGTESAGFPLIDYGNHRKRWLSKATCFTMRMATAISPVHKSLIESNYTYSKDFPAKQGILHYCSKVKASFHPIPYGFDSSVFKPKQDQRIQNSFVTMAFGIGQEKLRKLKGADLILEVAPRFPDCTFVLVGAEGLTEELPSNVTVHGAVPISEVPNLLSKYEFYFQLSVSEGFPNALGEAMLCGCIPIGSNVTSIPDIIGDSGFILNSRRVDELEKIIDQALKCDRTDLSNLARTKILRDYPANRRSHELVKLIQGMVV
ncbi:MAG: glycosyltransferase involved in cell wall biosynthesis [Bacteroidia bacterium]|jgi:glycosyltransferase involved in cell wall biosynthesis